MLVYAADKKQFMYDCNVRDIEDVMWERFKSVTGKSVSKQEVQSWKSSLNYVAKVLAGSFQATCRMSGLTVSGLLI